MEKWKALFESLEVNGEATHLRDEEAFRLFEEKAGMALPEGFREYCQVFGSGAHSREFFIFCPCSPGEKGDLLSFGLRSLESYKAEVVYEINHSLAGHPASDYDKMRWLEGLLENAFPFATDGFAEVFVWDLNSYSRADGSYDIYRVGMDELADACLVGRDFYRFVSEFIYEHKIDGVPLKNNRYPEVRRIFDRVGWIVGGGI